MVDLKGQYQKIKNEIDPAIQDVINSTAFINGPVVKEFQSDLEKYLHVKHVIPCANGTDALQIAMMALGLKPGDEVITASHTYVATAEVIGLLKLTPVLVEVDADSYCIDVKAIEKAITKQTKAIVPVHLYGQCADMEPILALAKKHDLYVIEDVAQAIGAEYTFSDGTRHKAGTMGHIGCTSFFPSKNLGCYGDGGAIFTNDSTLEKKLRMISIHGQSVQYVHDVIGVNSRLDSIQAAILKVKLKYLDGYNASRRKAADFYDQAFSGHPKIKIPTRSKNSTHVFHQYTIQLIGINRDKVREELAARDIPSMIYYPIPVHRQKAFQDEKNIPENFPVTEYLSRCVLSLPIHSEMDTETLAYITQSFLELIKTIEK